MKNLTFAIAISALVAFSLGLFVGAGFDRGQNESKNMVSTVRARPAEAPQQTDPIDTTYFAAKPKTNAIDGQAAAPAMLASTNRTPREIYAANKRKRLGDFFVINGIDAERANQIVESLIDVDHYVAQKQNAIVDRNVAENADRLAKGEVIGLGLTQEESEELDAERTVLYRDVFGEFYEAYNMYERSYQQRLVVRQFSEALTEPLEYAAGEAIVQIMYEENAELRAALQDAIATDTDEAPGGDSLDVYDRQLQATKSYNERVLSRTQSYLSPVQYEQLENLLDGEVRRTELYRELEKLNPGGRR